MRVYTRTATNCNYSVIVALIAPSMDYLEL